MYIFVRMGGFLVKDGLEMYDRSMQLQSNWHLYDVKMKRESGL